MIKTINGWRTIFALIIVLYHMGVERFVLMPAGVFFFFMASGMLLEMKHPFRSLDKQSYKKFALYSAIKIYPLHWFTLALLMVVLALIGQLEIDPLALTLNATLLHSWSMCHHIYFSYNQFSWFLSALLFCYLCFPLLSRWFMPLRLRQQLMIVGGLAAVCLTVMLFTDEYGFVAMTVFPPFRIIGFILGMMLVKVLPMLKHVKILNTEGTGTDAELASLALLCALTMMVEENSQGLYKLSEMCLWWIPVTILLIVCVFYNKREGFWGKILASKPMQWVSSIAFEFFMLQRVAALAFNYFVVPVLVHMGMGKPSPFAQPGVFDFGSVDPYSLLPWFVVPIDLLLSWVVNRLFTRPVKKLLVKYI